MPSEEAAQKLSQALTESTSRFRSLARNPLLLTMICRVATDGTLPANRAKILQLFTSWLMQRERAAFTQPGGVYEHILCEIAVATRTTGTTVLSQEEAIQVIHRTLRLLNSPCAVFDIIGQLTSANILRSDISKGICFIHELVLEYYAAKGLRARTRTGEMQLAEVVNRAEWSEVVRMYVGLNEEPNCELMEIVDLNVLLAVRCVTAGAESSLPLEKRIIAQCRATLNGSIDHVLKEQAITALLELGTKHALRVIVRLPIDRNSLFERALWKCERPEQASLNLLRFGFTGRERLHACIVALKGRRLSKRFAESRELIEAQSVLLRTPVVLKYVQAVEALEISPALKQPIAELMTAITSRQPDINLLTSVMNLAGKVGLSTGTVEHIRSVFPLSSALSGVQAYSVARLLAGLNESAAVTAAAVAYAKQCFQNQLALLGCKFAVGFNIIPMIDPLDVLGCAARAKEQGKIGQLLAISKAFGFPELTGFIDEGFVNAIEKGRMQIVVQYCEQLKERIHGKEEVVAKALIDSTRSGVMPGRTLSRIIKVFQLQSRFADLWTITSFNCVKHFGFARNVVTNEVSFFHISSLGNAYDVDKMGVAPHRLLSAIAEASQKNGVGVNLTLRNCVLL